MKLLVLCSLFLLAQSAEVQIAWNKGSTAVLRSIVLGDTVTWTTTDDLLHTIAGTNNDVLNSTLISSNITFAPISQWSYTFDTEGNFDFQCNQHPDTMYGTIVVVRERTTLQQSTSISGTNNGYYSIQGRANSQVTITVTLNNPANGGLIGVYVGTNAPPPHSPDSDYYVSCSSTTGAVAICRITISPCDDSVLNTYYVDVAPLDGSAASASFSIEASSVTSQFQVSANGTACCNAMSYYAVSPTPDYPVVAISITKVSGSFINEESPDVVDASWGMFINTDQQGCPSTDSAIQGQYVNFNKKDNTYAVNNLPKATTYYIGVTVPSSSGVSFSIRALSENVSPTTPITSGADKIVVFFMSTIACVILFML